MLETKRLRIRLASDDEMRELIKNEPDAGLKQAYGEMLELSIKNPESRKWYAVWFIELPNGVRVGDLCFKGLLANGEVEIGYGILPEFCGRGYASEAVKAAVKWALNEPGVKCISAETDESNVASQKVLKKAGFLPTGTRGEEGPRFILNKLP